MKPLGLPAQFVGVPLLLLGDGFQTLGLLLPRRPLVPDAVAIGIVPEPPQRAEQRRHSEAVDEERGELGADKTSREGDDHTSLLPQKAHHPAHAPT